MRKYRLIDTDENKDITDEFERSYAKSTEHIKSIHEDIDSFEHAVEEWLRVGGYGEACEYRLEIVTISAIITCKPIERRIVLDVSIEWVD